MYLADVGFSLKPPKWLRNVLRGVQVSVPGPAPQAAVQVQQPTPADAGVFTFPSSPSWLPVALAVGAAFVLPPLFKRLTGRGRR